MILIQKQVTQVLEMHFIYTIWPLEPQYARFYWYGQKF